MQFPLRIASLSCTWRKTCLLIYNILDQKIDEFVLFVLIFWYVLFLFAASLLRKENTLVRALIHARIDYCNGLLALCPKYLTDKLLSVLRAATRLILQFPYRSSVYWAHALAATLAWYSKSGDDQDRPARVRVPPRVGSPVPLRLVCPGASFVHSLLPAFSPGFGSIFSWSLERERKQMALLAYSLCSSNYRLLLSHLWMLSALTDKLQYLILKIIQFKWSPDFFIWFDLNYWLIKFFLQCQVLIFWC